MADIIETNGYEDAKWCLRLPAFKKIAMTFACDCAERVLHLFEEEYPNDDRPRKAIEAARKGADAADAADDDDANAAYAADADDDEAAEKKWQQRRLLELTETS